MGRGPAHSTVSHYAASQLGSGLRHLLARSMAKSTWATYEHAWRVLQQFLINFQIPLSLPLDPLTLAFFITHMWQLGYAATTVSTYLSAIAFMHKIQGYQDPTATFLLQKVMRGMQKGQQTHDTRLPISYSVLRRLVMAIDLCCDGHYKTSLYKSMFLVGFFAFLRVGEMAYCNKNTENILRLSNVHWLAGKMSYIISFHNYKHSKGQVAYISLYRQHSVSACPVAALQSYIKLRGDSPGFLFCWPGGYPITRQEFSTILTATLQICNLSPQVFKSHSLRIGAATYAASLGLSDAQIRALGRWNSNAFKRYIRPYSMDA